MANHTVETMGEKKRLKRLWKQKVSFTAESTFVEGTSKI